jgi:hypothetical protein
MGEFCSRLWDPRLARKIQTPLIPEEYGHLTTPSANSPWQNSTPADEWQQLRERATSGTIRALGKEVRRCRAFICSSSTRCATNTI